MEITSYDQQKLFPLLGVIPVKAGIQFFVKGPKNPGFPFSREGRKKSL